MLWEKTPCCFIGKGRLYKVLNAGVPIIVAHMVLVKKHYLYLNKKIMFKKMTFIYIKNMIQDFLSICKSMLSYTLGWLIFPWACNFWVSFPPLPPPSVCTVTTSCYIRERNTLMNTLTWFEYTIIMLRCKERGERTYDPSICVLICFVILQCRLTNISITCNSWASFPPS